MAATSKGKILILDTDQEVLDQSKRILEAQGYRAAVCLTGKEALALFKEQEFDLLLTEWKLDGGDGLDGFQVIETLAKLDAQLEFVILTGAADVDSAVKAMKMGARDYLKKPIAPDQLLEAVDLGLCHRREGLARRDRMTAFETMKKQIASSLNLSEVLDLVAAGVVKGMGLGIKGSAIALLDPKKSQLKVVAHQGLSREYLEKGPIDSSRSLGEMILKGEYIWIRDITQDPRVQYPEAARREGIASILSVPLTVKNEVIGALRVYTGEPREFDPEEIRCLHRFAEQAALAIENARTYEDIKKKYENLRTDLVDFFDDGWT
jgi:FixJ family two-component response regulator